MYSCFGKFKSNGPHILDQMAYEHGFHRGAARENIDFFLFHEHFRHVTSLKVGNFAIICYVDGK